MATSNACSQVPAISDSAAASASTSTPCYALDIPSFGQLVILSNVLSRREIQAVQARTEELGWRDLSSDPTIRPAQRVVMDSTDLADIVWARVQAPLAAAGMTKLEVSQEAAPMWPGGARGGWSSASLNWRWRAVRYPHGGHFAPHCDGVVQLDSGSVMSGYTFMIYLSDDFAGGGTSMLPAGLMRADLHAHPEKLAADAVQAAAAVVKPQAGWAVVFKQAELLHQGEPAGVRAAWEEWPSMAGEAVRVRPDRVAQAVQTELPPCDVCHVLPSGWAATLVSDMDPAPSPRSSEATRYSKYILRSDVMFNTRDIGSEPMELTEQQHRAAEAWRIAQQLEAAGQPFQAVEYYSTAGRLWPELAAGQVTL